MINSLSPNFIVFIIDEQVITLKTPLTYRVYHLLSEKMIAVTLIDSTWAPQAYRVYQYLVSQ